MKRAFLCNSKKYGMLSDEKYLTTDYKYCIIITYTVCAWEFFQYAIFFNFERIWEL